MKKTLIIGAALMMTIGGLAIADRFDQALSNTVAAQSLCFYPTTPAATNLREEMCMVFSYDGGAEERKCRTRVIAAPAAFTNAVTTWKNAEGL